MTGPLASSQKRPIAIEYEIKCTNNEVLKQVEVIFTTF